MVFKILILYLVYWNRCGGAPRTTLSLKSKYETFKKELRKKVAKYKLEHFKTGGGESEGMPLTPAEERIYNMIYLSVDGLRGRFDDDNNVAENELHLKDGNQPDLINEYGNVEVECIPIVQGACNTEDIETSTFLPGNEMPPEVISKSVVTPPPPMQTPQKNKVQYSATSRQNLKRPLSKQFTGIQSTNLQTKIAAAQKVNILSVAKKTLLELQSKFTEKEIEFQEKEHNLKLRKLEKELESAELEAEIKKMGKKIKEEALKKILKDTQNVFNI